MGPDSDENNSVKWQQSLISNCIWKKARPLAKSSKPKTLVALKEELSFRWTVELWKSGAGLLSPRSCLQLRRSTLWVPAGFHDYSNLPRCVPNPAFSSTTLVKISIKTNKPKQTSQHWRTGSHLIKSFSAASSLIDTFDSFREIWYWHREKYLTVFFSASASSSVPMKTVYACQGSQLALTCPPDHQVKVFLDFFGSYVYFMYHGWKRTLFSNTPHPWPPDPGDARQLRPLLRRDLQRQGRHRLERQLHGA